MKSVYSSHSFGGRGPVRRSGFSEAPVTKWLMIVLAVFLVIDVTGRNELSSGTLMPYLELDDGLLIQLWRWVSYPFVSLDLGEWLFSMIVLFSFGKTLEPVLNSRRFAVLLGITTMVGSMIYAMLLTTSQSPLTGSSGWAVAILVAVALLNPNQEVQLLIPPVPLKIKHLVGGLIVIMVVMAIAQRQDPAVTLAQLSAIGVSFLCMKNRHWLDLGINSKKGQKRSKSVQSRSQYESE